MPKFTSVETYAAAKEYSLYIVTYGNVITAGYIHGVYLKYGGKEINNTNKSEIAEDYYTFMLFQIVVAAIISIWGAVNNNTVILFLGVGLFSSNLVSYYQYLYQAVGDFKSYGVSLNASKVITLVLYLLLLFLVKPKNYALYIAVPITSEIIIAIYMSIRLNRQLSLSSQIKFSVRTAWNNIKQGFVLMLGSFTSRCFTTIDRWFVKVLLSTYSFASYSFAVSLENVVNSFMSPLTISLYSAFCRKVNFNKIRLLKDTMSLYGCLVIVAAFPAKWILEHFMTQYLSATVVMFPLFAAQAIGTVVKAIYVNLYKANGNQKKYLHQILAMLCLSFVSNTVFYFFMRSVIAIAMATLFTNTVWLILCEYENPEIRYSWKSVVGFVAIITVYLLTGVNMSSVVGCFVYLLSVCIISLVLLKDCCILILNKGWEFVRLKIRK